MTGLPAISVPEGFSADALPVGVQNVGKNRDELGVLQTAYAFERVAQVRPQHLRGVAPRKMPELWDLLDRIGSDSGMTEHYAKRQDEGADH
jgi:hypothetical protein